MKVMQTPFIKARIILTAWYSSILFCILFLFSLALYSSQSQNFVRVVLQRQFGSHPPRIITLQEREEIVEQIETLRNSTAINLVFWDGIILLLGTGLSYILAGKTLEPIEKAQKEQKEFLANASHELRTPLAALQTATEVALRSEKSKATYKGVLGQVHEETLRLSKIVNDLLFLSRVDMHAVPFSFSKVDLHQIIGDVINEVSHMAEEKKIEITKKIEKITMQGDKNRLKQLVLILLDNAIKYIPESGKISISLRRVKEKVVLEVVDTGIGMTEEEQQHIFDRFYRADTSRSTEGAGLGMSIAKQITDAHNAKITVESTQKKGTTITVEFINQG